MRDILQHVVPKLMKEHKSLPNPNESQEGAYKDGGGMGHLPPTSLSKR